MQSDSAQSETGLDDKFQELMQKSNDKFIEDLASDGELFWNLLTKLPDESNRKFLIKLVNAQFEKPDLFASLINFKAQPDQGQSDKINLFLRAIKEGHYEFAKFLSKSGADLRSTDTNNNNFEDLIRNKVNTEHHDKTKEEKQKIVFDLSSEIRSVNPSILQEVYYQRNIKIPVKITQDPKLKAYHQYLKEALDTKILASQLTRHASFQDTRGQIERDVAEKLIPEQVHKILIAPALDIIQARRLHGDATGLIDSSRDFPPYFQ